MRSPVPEGSAALQSGKPEKSAQASGRPCRAGKLARALFTLLLVASMAVPLAGCKDTDVLTQKVIDQNAEVVDYSLEPVRQSAANDNPDNKREDMQDEGRSTEEQRSDDPQYDSQEQTVDNETDSDANSDNTLRRDAANKGNDDADSNDNAPGDAAGADSSVGGGAGSGEGSNTADGAEAHDPTPTPITVVDTPSNGDNDENSGDDNSPTDSTTQPGNEGLGTNPEKPGNNGGTAPIVDGGTYEDMRPSKRIAAAGQNATIVQMLAPGALTCSDSYWISKVNATGVFSGASEITSVTCAWENGSYSAGDTALAVSASSADTLQAIVDSGADTVLWSTQYGYLTPEQQTWLADNGVQVVPMPELGYADTPDEDITLAVQVVGTLLKDADYRVDGKGPLGMAQEYNRVKSGMIESSVDKSGGYTVTLIAGRSDAMVYQPNGGTVGTPASSFKATAYADSIYVPDVAEVAEGRAGGYALSDDVWHGARPSLYPATKGESFVTLDVSDGYLSSPQARRNGQRALVDYYFQCSGVMNKGDVSVFAYCTIRLNRQLIEPQYDLFFPTQAEGSITSYHLVGDDFFPAVLCRDYTIASAIESSKAKPNGYYNVGQDYSVWVLPSGFSGSWADGTVESWLLPAYIRWLYWDDSSLIGEIGDFYATFYRASYTSAISGTGF